MEVDERSLKTGKWETQNVTWWRAGTKKRKEEEEEKEEDDKKKRREWQWRQ